MRTSLSQSITGILIASSSLLPVFSSTAQAHWSDPVYTVTDRTPEIIPDLGTPFSEHDAYGYNFGEELTDTPTEGTITAKFTWVHDVANDTPPSDVYVLQHAEAGWDVYDANARAEKVNALPSVQEAVFVPNRDRHKARVRLVQDLDEPGTADNGLGDAQVVENPPGDGTHGKSSGYGAVLCHPATDGTLTTPALTMSADVTAPENMISYSSFDYSAQIIDLEITRDGTNITDPLTSDLKEVNVGEPIHLTATISGLPTEVNVTGKAWTVEGTTVKSYTQTTSEGKKVDLSSTDLLNKDTLGFYWFKGADGTAGTKVKFDVNIDGKPVQLVSTFNVNRPTMNHFTGTYTTVNPPVHIFQPFTNPPFEPQLMLGQLANDGMTWDGQVSTGPKGEGEIAIVQIVKSNTVYTYDDNSTKTYNTDDPITPGDDYVLDDGLGIYYNGTTSIGNSDTEPRNTSDTPSDKLFVKDPVTNVVTYPAKHVVDTAAFTTHLMYKAKDKYTADANIWVPLSVLTWNFEGEAAKVAGTSTWNKVGNGVPYTAPGTTLPVITGSDTTTVPEWKNNYTYVFDHPVVGP